MYMASKNGFRRVASPEYTPTTNPRFGPIKSAITTGVLARCPKIGFPLLFIDSNAIGDVDSENPPSRVPALALVTAERMRPYASNPVTSVYAHTPTSNAVRVADAGMHCATVRTPSSAFTNDENTRFVVNQFGGVPGAVPAAGVAYVVSFAPAALPAVLFHVVVPTPTSPPNVAPPSAQAVA
jgi:hypothetical protein